MRILEFYTGEKTYMYPSGKLATPVQVLADFPAILTFLHAIETDESGQVLFSVDNFSAMRTRYNIDNSLTNEEALTAIQEIMNAPEPEGEPTAEERIASALEFQTLMMLPDEEEE